MRMFHRSGVLRGHSRQSGSQRRGVVLILTAVAFVGICAMVGLAIDVGTLYFIKARLSQAADAASLAGARSLSRGTDIGTQQQSAQTVAANFFNANFPSGFWGCTTSYSPALVWQDTINTKIRYVKFSATASAPLYFLKVLGVNSTVLGTTATAARRDANVMVILDRSGSMSSAINQLVDSATWFVGQFAQGRDKVGLVTFGGSYNLIKPTLTSIPTVNTAINTLSSSNVYGTTNHAQPLWVAYQALAEANESGALNAIVFFTDGQPNTITANWVSTDGTTPPPAGTTGNLRNATTCNNGFTGSGTNKAYLPVIGYALTYTDGSIGGLFNSTVSYPPYQPNSTSGPGSAYTAYVNTAYDANDSGVALSMVNSSGCHFTSSFNSDFVQIPTSDYYGNSTNPTGAYKSVTLTSINGTNLTAAAYNAADYSAQRMRAGALNGIVPLIDTIALSTTGTVPESAYMKRLANTLDSGSYDSTKPTGLYVYVSSTADLQSAFVQIAAQILHLSQ